MIEQTLMPISGAPRRRVAPANLKRSAAGIVLAVALAAWSTTGSAAVGTAGDTVQNLYTNLVATMKSGSVLGGSGRYTQLAPVIRC